MQSAWTVQRLAHDFRHFGSECERERPQPTAKPMRVEALKCVRSYKQ